MGERGSIGTVSNLLCVSFNFFFSPKKVWVVCFCYRVNRSAFVLFNKRLDISLGFWCVAFFFLLFGFGFFCCVFFSFQ